MSRAATPPGWFPDPWKRHRVRYWGGDGWTDWVADEEPTPFIDTVEAHDDLVAPPTRRSRDAGLLVGAACGLGAIVVALLAWGIVTSLDDPLRGEEEAYGRIFGAMFAFVCAAGALAVGALAVGIGVVAWIRERPSGIRLASCLLVCVLGAIAVAFAIMSLVPYVEAST